jgi:Tfp pilus assembly protein PilF
MFERAEHAYLRAVELRATSLYYGNLGVLYHRWKKYGEAADAYKRSLVLDPDNQSSLKNLESIPMGDRHASKSMGIRQD